MRNATTTIRTMRAYFVLVLSLMILPGSSAAVAQADQASTEHAILPSPGSRDSICLMIESAARANDLPVEYFARVIWLAPKVTRNRTRTSALERQENR